MIQEIIKAETELEERIISDEYFKYGAMWGKPRNGHPEGQVIYHIGNVLKNVDKYSNSKNREALRLIAIIHDTFKFKVDRTKPKSGENHHAMIARRFAERYITDKEILEIIELHDEAYNSWCKGDKNNNWYIAEKRATQLIYRLVNSIPLYLTFYRCDNEAGGKDGADYVWFSEMCKF